MTEKDLKRLSRAELLELLLLQTRETERAQARAKQLEEALSKRQLKIQEAGDLAHAVLAVNGVMETAQRAAKQYLENIEQMQSETKERCAEIIEKARQEAERIIREAKEAQKEPDTDQILEEIYELLNH